MEADLQLSGEEYFNEYIYDDDISFDYTVSRTSIKSHYLHCHDTYEVYFFISGNVSYLVEGKQYTPTPSSILLLSPNVFHGVRINTDEPYERFALHFNPRVISAENSSLLLSSFSKKSSSSDIYFENADRYNLLRYFQNLLECKDLSANIQKAIVNIRVENLLSQILYMSHEIKGTSQEYNNRYIKNIIEYLNANLTKNLNLDLIAEQFFISKYHLNTIFKKYTGTTVMNYIIHKRIAMARQLLLQGIPAFEAAERSGFHDYSVFYRAYKKLYGYSPSQKLEKESQ